MKQSIVILLLAVLLLNWGGYSFLSDYFEAKADQNLQASVDSYRYKEDELVKIKVPAALPYGTSSEQYERVNGSIKIGGITYNYVKRRFYQDTLELYCIPNFEKKSIENARDAFSRLANDFVTLNGAAGKESNHTHSSKFAAPDFTNDSYFTWRCNTATLTGSITPLYPSRIKNEYRAKQYKPPRLAHFSI